MSRMWVLQGYANGYGHYVTTPEEYGEQLYEAGSTVFGRHQLAVLQDAVVELAAALRGGAIVDPGRPPPPRRLRWTLPVGSPRLARAGRPGVRHAPVTARTGEVVTATFGTDHPNAELRPTYLRVERRDGGAWLPVADDASPTTTITWRRDRALRFVAEVTWVAGPPGSYRITCVGRTDATTPPIVVH
ncbi:neutral/alkaline non-lysosomal ceramidase N-terminal domain-containing protein [Nocardioides sp. L-11A]|uniref:neutral/alkaline non-lysosomal ceramidase N-terminal domain-containing protein n=1 Tax=Nocardioides sp. L-11A TaxID=3043848 RepID=UPI002499FC17|nr:neutral/alkaline non-lysosomal ceramidase N-terminal domain-containing protein [Nocardioides sp. L-11A]